MTGVSSLYVLAFSKSWKQKRKGTPQVYEGNTFRFLLPEEAMPLLPFTFLKEALEKAHAISTILFRGDIFPNRVITSYWGLNRQANEPLLTPESMWYYNEQNESQFTLSIESSLIFPCLHSAGVTPTLNESNTRCANKRLRVKLETSCSSVLLYSVAWNTDWVAGWSNFAGVGGN